MPWLIGVARHKLVDHWRRRARDSRLVDDLSGRAYDTEDPWDERMAAMDAAVEHVGIWDEGAALRVPRPPSLTLFLEVPALEVAADTIRQQGGTVEDLPAETDMGPYYSVRCTDDQGTGFALMSTRLNM